MSTSPYEGHPVPSKQPILSFHIHGEFAAHVLESEYEAHPEGPDSDVVVVSAALVVGTVVVVEVVVVVDVVVVVVVGL